MISAILSCILPAGLIGTAVGTLPTHKTLENLQTAFEGESNAHARYAAFAAAAEAEGFGQVASLFRATSRAEEIHAANHARVIRQMGAEPKAVVQAPDVKSTRENLQTAINGEVYERDTMYPAFVDEAKGEKNGAAIKTFVYALKTETEHARLFTEALKNLDSLRGASKQYFVCSHCGYTVEKLNFLTCIVCGHAKEDYIPVS
ncbi:MAG TPA: rubrerythrin family protein [Acidisarcina sp.]|nr:rubrerythrin family protein [Acidisarcina sp.]